LQRGDRGLAVNYGRFANNKQAKKAFRKVKQNYKALRAGYLQFPYIKEIPRPNPAAPAQWDLLNNNCDFTFEIGTYFDLPEKNYYNRKQDAVNAVKKLRQEGEAEMRLFTRRASYCFCRSIRIDMSTERLFIISGRRLCFEGSLLLNHNLWDDNQYLSSQQKC